MKRLLPSIGIAACILAFFLLPDLWLLNSPGGRIFLTRPDVLLCVALIALSIGFAGSRLLAVSAFVLLGLMLLVAESFNAYFGGELEWFHVTLLFAEAADVARSSADEIGKHAELLVSVLLFGCILWMLAQRRVQRTTVKGASFVVLVMLAAAPARVALRADVDPFSPDPAMPMLVNALQTFSYALMVESGRIDTVDTEFQPYRVRRAASVPEPPIVVLVIGEGIAPARMGLYGASRPTTPRLSAWQGRKAGTLLVKRGFSAAVATHASMALLLNAQAEPNNREVSMRKDTNLFRLAKTQGFSTQFLSAQKVNLIAGSGERFIDVIRTLDEHRSYFEAHGDFGLIDWLRDEDLDAARGQLIVIQQRNIHGPYHRNYAQAPQFAVWPTAGVDQWEARRNAYDNAMLYYDSFITELAESMLERYAERRPVFIFATSDHGQVFGAGDNRWGHSVLIPEVADVPFLLFTNRPDSPVARHFSETELVTHYSLACRVAEALGYTIENPNLRPNRALVNGPLKFGFGGYMSITAERWPGPAGVSVFDRRGELIRQWYQSTPRHGPH